MTSKQDRSKILHSDTGKRLLVCLGCGLLAASLWWLPVTKDFVRHLEVKTRDVLMLNDKRLEPRADLVFLGIDSNSLLAGGASDQEISTSETLQRMQERYPWDRRVYAAAIDKLANAGAKVIVLDIVLAQKSTPEQDQALAEAIARHRDKIVLTSAFIPMATAHGNDGMQVLEPYEEFLGPLENETGFGFANFWSIQEDVRAAVERVDGLQDDGVIRYAHFRRTLGEANGKIAHPDEPVYESIAAVAARKMGGVIPSEPRRFRMGIKTGGKATDSYEPLSVASIFTEKEWEHNYKRGEFFRDKLVIIGPAMPLFQDSHQTAAGKVYGAQLHLHVIAAILDEAWYDEVWPTDRVLIILCLVALFLGAFGAYYFNKAISLSGYWLAYIIVMALLMAAGVNWMNRLFGGWGVGLAFSFEMLGMIIWQAIKERTQRIQLHGHLQRSMSPDVADAIVKAPDGYYRAASGNRKQVTVLFADVRGFTNRSEQQDAGELVSQLNEYLGRMVEVIFAHGGTVDKFIGDAIMVTWGGLDDSDVSKQNEAAVSAAQDMLDALSELNVNWEKEGKEPFRIGVGIHHGEAIVGEIGSDQRTDFTVIGDAVNLASRIEGMTKAMGVDLLITSSVNDVMLMGENWVGVGAIRVKGREEGVELWIPNRGSELEQSYLQKFLGEFQQGAFEQAMATLNQIDMDGPFAGLVKFYQAQIKHIKQTPGIARNWDGVLRMETK